MVAQLGDEGGEEWIFTKVSNKIKASNLRAGKNILLGQTTSVFNEATAEQIDGLVSPPVPEEEEADLRAVLETLRATTAPTRHPTPKGIRRRLGLLNLGAEAGPSGMRNNMLLLLRGVRNGVTALQKWAGMWNNGRVCAYTSSLWTTGLCIPVDCGEKPATVTGRKLRPITLLEVLVKFAESVCLDEAAETVKTYMEPAQLGVGTPDGNVILLRVLQSWAEDMETDNAQAVQDGRLEALQAIAPLDFTNAYGMFFRSHVVHEVMEHLPILNGLIKAEWQNGCNHYWQRVEGEWRKGSTRRGGFQGL
eukprot:2975424-Karenia_brevis.AAC.1